MSGGEPLWRRVAGLYLSGIPVGERDGMTTRAHPANGGHAGSTHEEDDVDAKQAVVQLGEALDLITLAQGYQSPAVPLLLRALIRRVRQMGAAPAMMPEAEQVAPVAESGADAARTEPVPSTEPAPTKAEDEAVAATPAGESEADAEVASEPQPDRDGALEERFKETDQKVSALTAALGQLVDVLQRRARAGGAVDRRAFPRVPGGNVTLSVRGIDYEVVNWSRSGFLIRIGEGDRFSRGGFDFHFILELPEETIQFQGRALPVRIERTRLAAEFVGLDKTIADKLSEIATRLASAPV